MNLKDAPIQRKLMLIILLTTVAALLLTRAIFFSYEFVAFRQTLLQKVSTIGDLIAANCNTALFYNDQKTAEEILAGLKTDPHLAAAVVFDHEGKVFAKYPLRLAEEETPVGPGETGYNFQHLALSGFQPITENGKFRGTLYLRYDVSDIMRDWLRNSVVIALFVLVFMVVLAFFISKQLQKRISVPILSLVETARAVSGRRDFSVRAAKASEDELGLLTDAFNQMLDQIQAQTAALEKKEQDLRAALDTARQAEEEVRQANQELESRVARRTEQLEAANRELESFSYSVSHDLRAPLRHVQGYTEMLVRATDGQLTDKPRRYLKTIMDASVQMGQLIDDLLSFSRLGRAEIHETTVELNALVKSALAGQEMEIRARQIDWRIAPLPAVMGDPALLRQVFANLIGNALKYSRERDPAQIEIGCAGEESGNVICFVRDNGAGFDMRYAHKLFGVFQRLHRAEEFEGTGIGLATVRRIVARHGGRTWAEGEVNQGATFYFTLRPASAGPTKESR